MAQEDLRTKTISDEMCKKSAKRFIELALSKEIPFEQREAFVKYMNDAAKYAVRALRAEKQFVVDSLLEIKGDYPAPPKPSSENKNILYDKEEFPPQIEDHRYKLCVRNGKIFVLLKTLYMNNYWSVWAPEEMIVEFSQDIGLYGVPATQSGEQKGISKEKTPQIYKKWYKKIREELERQYDIYLSKELS